MSHPLRVDGGDSGSAIFGMSARNEIVQKVDWSLSRLDDPADQIGIFKSSVTWIDTEAAPGLGLSPAPAQAWRKCSKEFDSV